MSTNRQILDVERRRTRVPSLTMIIVAFMVVLAALMMLHQRSRAQNVVSPIEVLLGTPAGPSGEIQTITQGPVTVYVPPGAITEEGTISISLASPDLALVADDSGWTRTQVVNVEFRNPNGTLLEEISFYEPIEICFNLTQQDWQAFMSQIDAYQVQHFDEQANSPGWVMLPEETYPARRQLCGQTTHLSLFALANSLGLPATEPTSAGPVFGTLVPTRTSVPSNPTRDRRRDGASSEGGLPPARTSVPPTNPPPTPAPTQQPTLAPTQTPIEVPTLIPTQEPVLPTSTPDAPVPTATEEPMPTADPSLGELICTLLCP